MRTMPKFTDVVNSEFRKFTKPIFKPAVIDVVTLSDSDDSKEPSDLEIIEKPCEVISISESSSSEEDTSIEVITLDPVNVNCKQCTGFCVHIETPDYIPIPLTKMKKTKRFKRKRAKTTNVDTAKKVKRLALKKRPYEYKSDKPTIKLAHPNIASTAIISNNDNKPSSGLRPVIIDGSNVAFAYGKGEFKARGIIEVIKFFLKRGHEEILCFLPAHYRHKGRTPDEDKILCAYEKDRLVTYTPSRFLNGEYVTPYDDRFIVQYASEKGGVIISNDGYRDLLEEEDSWRETIENRIINFTFARDLLMFPKDPLGPHGPSLDEMLRFS